MFFSFFVRINQDWIEILFGRFSKQRNFESDDVCGGLYIFGGISDFGGFGVPAP